MVFIEVLKIILVIIVVALLGLAGIIVYASHSAAKVVARIFTPDEYLNIVTKLASEYVKQNNVMYNLYNGADIDHVSDEITNYIIEEIVNSDEEKYNEIKKYIVDIPECTRNVVKHYLDFVNDATEVLFVDDDDDEIPMPKNNDVDQIDTTDIGVGDHWIFTGYYSTKKNTSNPTIPPIDWNEADPSELPPIDWNKADPSELPPIDFYNYDDI